MVNRELIPCKTIDAQVKLPGSKYVANRLVVLCALSNSRSKLSNVVDNNDIRTAIAGLNQLGYELHSTADHLIVNPRLSSPNSALSLYSAHSGTFSRFVTAIAALETTEVTIECSEKMATRPMQELFDCLRQLKVTITTQNQPQQAETLPATIKGPIRGNQCTLDAARSSQYLSALLMVAPFLPDGLQIRLTGEVVSRAYVDMTIRLMAKLGVLVVETQEAQSLLFSVASGQSYQGIEYEIPCDPVSASYFMGAAAISGGKVTIQGFDYDSVQGEARFYQVLEKMGAKIEVNESQLTIIGTDELNGIEVDMSNMPDAVQTLAAVACFARGKTKITNIAHLAYKESNRIEDTAIELRKTGIQVKSGSDYLIITGGKPQSANIETHEDHRMAMSMALLGIKTPGIVIHDAQVVEKSFPDYWNYLANIGVLSVEQ